MGDFGQPRIVLGYELNGLSHTLGLRLAHGANPLDHTTMDTLGLDFANAFKVALSDQGVITQCYTQSHLGLKLIEIDLGADIEGTHASTAGSHNYKSLTFTLVGRSSAIGSGGHVGHTLVRYFVGGAYTVLPGDKKLVITTLDPDGRFISFLRDDTRCFCDFYGSKCILENVGEIQFNAYVQNRHGA